MSLAELAGELEQPLALLGALDALGDDREAEDLAEVDDRPQQRGLVARLPDALDERLVDLQAVQRHPAQVAQRGVAGPEVVDRQLDPEVLQRI